VAYWQTGEVAGSSGSADSRDACGHASEQCGAHGQTCTVGGKNTLDMLVVLPLTEEEVMTKEDTMDLDRLIATTKVNMKSLYKQCDVLNAKVRRVQNVKSHIIQVLTSLTKISVDQSKERERLSRRGRHEDGRFTPIVLTKAHQSPGHHVYDRHETLTKDQHSLLTLQDRNDRSAGLTPLWATVIEKEASLDAAESQIPYYPGARRSMMKRIQQLWFEETATRTENKS
jgi:hypothetical protein